MLCQNLLLLFPTWAMFSKYQFKFSQKTLIYSLLLAWVVFINIWIYNYKYGSKVSNVSIYDEEFLSNPIADQKFDNPDAQKAAAVSDEPVKQVDVLNHKTVKELMAALNIKDSRRIDSHSAIYDNILANHDLKDIVLNLNFQQRCDLYFKNLYLDDNNWFLDPNADLPLDHRFEFDYEPFRKLVKQEIKEKIAKDRKIDVKQVKEDETFEQIVKDQYAKFWDKTMGIEQKITNYLSHMRIFNKCYLTNDNSYQISRNNDMIKKEAALRSQKDSRKFKYTFNEDLVNTKSFASCNNIESRVYKWLSFAFPIYERWTGEKFFTPPDMKKFMAYPEVFTPSNPKFNLKTGKTIKSDFTGNQACFLNRFKNALNGKGIVLSIHNGHVDDTVRLIHLLRALNNHYPIQIVYYDALNDISKTKLVNAARNRLTDLPESFQKVSQFFPEDYLDGASGLPKQEIWFVNAYNAINIHYRKKFNGFANKFLATIFNSFEEYMLLDADSVLVQNPDYFFNLRNYVNQGAYFFRDRTAAEFRPLSDGKFFQKVTPSALDHLIFDIPIITKKTMNLEFFQGMRHFMESGLVMINRNLHFNSVLMMIQMNMFTPVTSRVYGDKEVFWLGFIANGDEEFKFNKYFAAAIGTETPEEDRKNPEGKAPRGREVCSAHPGHINGEDGRSLLWFNSGYQFCSKEVNFEEEVAKQERLKFIKDANTLKTYYENPIQLKHAVIPPFKNKWETMCSNVEGEPNQGWRMDRGYCNSYLWCAYSSIGGKTKDGGDNTQNGKFFEFDEKSVALFNYYGDVWVGNE